ncbi:hypothetical protein [Streptomyces sp. NPDC060035]|uniref:hypothetical protein n=1 Tax=Streptomyces sp. NPDC060035 TaxID=3347044 RepID=UPI0036BDAA0A
MSISPPLIAVIGPVEPDLLRAFITHYRDGVGIRDFHLAFHFTEHASRALRDQLITVCEEMVGPPTVISQGPWHETVHSELRDHLRVRAGAGWHVIADIDEFHDYPVPPAELISAAETAGSPIVGGLLFDRVAQDGSIKPWSPNEGLDKAYPLGGYLTPKLLGGNPGKIVIAHSSVRLGLGSHRSLDEFPVNRPLVPVHHFKWRAGILQDLTRRVTEHTKGDWHEKGPWIRNEASALLGHVEQQGGRIDVSDQRLMFRPAAFGKIPDGWEKDSVDLVAEAMRLCDEHEWSDVLAPIPASEAQAGELPC